MDTYNADLRDAEGFVGDRASRRAFAACSAALVEDWRKRLRKSRQEDPLGEIPAREFKKKKLDKVLARRGSRKPQLSSIAPSRILHRSLPPLFAGSCVSRSGARHRPSWSAVGSGRADRESLPSAAPAFFSKLKVNAVKLEAIRCHPDEAGLVGCVQLAPSCIFSGHDSILAVDIGAAPTSWPALSSSTSRRPRTFLLRG